MLQDFNDLRRVGYGDTEIVVEALKMALADVKAELLKKRAEDASNLYKSSLRTKIPKELQTQSGAQNPVELSAHPANSQQKK